MPDPLELEPDCLVDGEDELHNDGMEQCENCPDVRAECSCGHNP